MLRWFKSILKQQSRDLETVKDNLDPQVKGDLLRMVKILARLKQIQSILDRMGWDLPFRWDEDTVKPRCARHDVALKRVYVRDGSTKTFEPLDDWWECPECEPDNRLIYVPIVREP